MCLRASGCVVQCSDVCMHLAKKLMYILASINVEKKFL